MNKDFASQSSAAASKSGANKAVLLFGVVMLGIIAMFFVVKQKKTSTKPVEVVVKAKEKKVVAVLGGKTDGSAVSFDFYQMLSQAKVPVLNTTPPVILVKAQVYVLQIASVKNKSDALRLQKELEALGVVSTVKKTTFSSGQVWFRVLSSPFSDQVKAEKTQDKLRVHKIDSLLVKAPSTSSN